MRQLAGIAFFFFTALVCAKAQHNRLEVELAEKLGLCTSQKGPAANANSTTFPCNQCKFNFISLSPGATPDQLFFLEIQSPNHCGSGGCTGTVYRKRAGFYEEVNNFFGFFEKTIPQPGKQQTPDLVYIHTEYPQHDFDNNGSRDPATLRVRYRWNNSHQTYEVLDILSIEANGKPISLDSWRKKLLDEFRQKSPWMY
ncbi:MAG: hypothetical protein KDC66_12085 [Phaeodactylibacter sp.]|nr:hypothetical protein [Phaeodactylibacter sp.]MCB9274228.1 hypothetical protein [Lewinellaceae bacterium]